MSTVTLPTRPVPSYSTDASREGFILGVGFLAAVAYLIALSWTIWNGSFDIWGGLIVAPILLAVTIPLVTREARREGDLRLMHLLQLAVVAKVVVGTLARYAVVFGVYGSGDAQGFHGAGQLISESIRKGNFAFDVGGGGEGTVALNIVTGIIYTITGPSKLAGFFVYSWLAFIGLFLFYKAYRLAVPEGDYRRYALFVFFLPTLVFWPSSIGKEAWMMFMLGIAVYGAARIFTQARGGFLILGVGLVGSAIVRPHLTLLVFLGLAVGYLLRRPTRSSGKLGSGKILGIAVLVVVGIVLVGKFQNYFNIGGDEGGSVQGLLDSTAEKSVAGGGSDFEAINVTNNPAQFPLAVLTVLFRPFPFEANNLQALVSSIEGVLLLGLFVKSWRRVVDAARASFRTPLVALHAIYTVLYIVAFSTIGNFGILARQRALVYPFFIALLTVAIARQSAQTPVEARWTRQAET